MASYDPELIQTMRAALDPKDETGIGSSMSFKTDLAKMQADLSGIAKSGGSAGIRKVADDFIAAHAKITPDQKQMALMSLLNFYRPPQDNETVLKLVGEVKALAPDSETGKNAAAIEERVKEMIAKAGAAKPAAK